MYVFLNGIIQVIVFFEHRTKDGVRASHNEEKTDGKNGNHHRKGKRHGGADGDCHDQGKNNHQRTTNSGSDQHHERHLHVAHVGGQSGHKTWGGKFVNVGKGIFLYRYVQVMAQILGKAAGCHGTVVPRQGAKGKG